MMCVAFWNQKSNLENIVIRNHIEIIKLLKY